MRSNVSDVLDEMDRLCEEVTAMLNVLSHDGRFSADHLDTCYMAVATVRAVLHKSLYRREVPA